MERLHMLFKDSFYSPGKQAPTVIKHELFVPYFYIYLALENSSAYRLYAERDFF